MINTLNKKYREEILSKLKEEFSIENDFAVPALKKIVVNIGVGKVKEDKKKIESIVADLKKITGQASVKTLARISIAGF